MTSRPPAQCAYCKHWISALEPGSGGKQTCAAYPKGIPDAIWWNRADHRKSQPGDHGIQWEADEDAQFPEYAMNT